MQTPIQYFGDAIASYFDRAAEYIYFATEDDAVAIDED